MAKLGTNVFVATLGMGAGTVAACQVGSSSLSGCVAVATLSTNGNPAENSGSVATF